ncbi:hypothetical protein, partial [Pandoraea apista]|uniref:hypothetical protein n=1 Tax=Pandoraea apista TaxID=93218 RepID=UPI001C8B49CB
MAVTEVSKGNTIPASICMPERKVRADVSAVPAGYTTLPAASRTAAPRTLPSGTVLGAAVRD